MEPINKVTSNAAHLNDGKRRRLALTVVQNKQTVTEAVANLQVSRKFMVRRYLPWK